MTAIRATFVKFLDVPSRKVVQIVLEIPTEEADHALGVLGGWPRPDVSRWVAVAPLTEKAATRPVQEPAEAKPDKPRRRMSELSRAQQAGIMCNDERFQDWLVRRFELSVNNKVMTTAEAAAQFVRAYCKVKSRTQLDTEPDRGAIFDGLRSEFDAYMGRTARPDERSAG